VQGQGPTVRVASYAWQEHTALEFGNKQSATSSVQQQHAVNRSKHRSCGDNPSQLSLHVWYPWQAPDSRVYEHTWYRLGVLCHTSLHTTTDTGVVRTQ